MITNDLGVQITNDGFFDFYVSMDFHFLKSGCDRSGQTLRK